MGSSNQDFSTRAIHEGYEPEGEYGSRQVPIYQTAAYVFPDAKQAAERFALDKLGPIYTRTDNPTNAVLEKRLASLEGGVGCVVTSSGIAAQMIAVASLMQPGNHAVVSNKLYGGSTNQWQHTFPRHFGWESDAVDINDLDAVKASITDKTKLIYTESIANPSCVVADMEALAQIAHDAGIPLVVDNTMATPYLCRPIEWGADVVVHSTTKFLNGNCTAMGGAVISSGKFDFSSAKFPMISEQDPTYGLSFADQFGEMAFTAHNMAVGLRDLGPCQAPFNSFLTLNGIETLELRMERHCQNAQAVAEFLAGHEEVSWVHYAGLDSSADHVRAQKYLAKGAGAVFSFGVKGGFDAALKTVESVKLFSLLANIGDTRSLLIHPASTTHSQLDEAQCLGAGIAPEMIRLSIGIESVNDIIADLDHALKNATLSKAA